MSGARASVRPYRRSLILGTFCFLLSVACSTDKKPASDSAAVNESAAATGSTGAPPSNPVQGLDGSPGAAPDRTLSYLRGLTFDKPGVGDYIEGLVPCDKPSDCAGRDSINLLIVPEKMAHKVDWVRSVDASLPYDGHVVAMIINKDNVKFRPFDLSPGDTAYEWVGPLYPTSYSEKAAAFYKINSAYGSLRGGPYAATKFSICGTPHSHDHAAVHLNKPDCSKASRVVYPMDSASEKTAVARVVPQDGGLWVSCDNGCCQVGAANKWTEVLPLSKARSQ